MDPNRPNKQSLPGFRELFSEFVVEEEQQQKQQQQKQQQQQQGHGDRIRSGTGLVHYPAAQNVAMPYTPLSHLQPPHTASGRHSRQDPVYTNTFPTTPAPRHPSENLDLTPHVNSTAPGRQIVDRTARSPNDDKKYMCQVCHKFFSRPSAVEAHMPSHTGERPYQCTHAGCTKTFTTKSNMRRHCQTHTAYPLYPAASPTYSAHTHFRGS